jgi:hypothetical protein
MKVFLSKKKKKYVFPTQLESLIRIAASPFLRPKRMFTLQVAHDLVPQSGSEHVTCIAIDQTKVAVVMRGSVGLAAVARLPPTCHKFLT